MGLVTFLVVVVLLLIWLIVDILFGKSKIEHALKEAICDILGCK